MSLLGIFRCSTTARNNLYTAIVQGLTGAIYLKHEVNVKALQFLRCDR
jgi:hypothetical protein